MKKIKIVLLVCLAMVFAVMPVRAAFAADKPDYRIAISPSIDDLGDLKPGEQKTGNFKVYNDGTKDFEFDVSFAPYSVQTETYEPSFTTENQYTDLKDWIETDISEGALEAGREQVINYTINVPSGFHGGMQGAAILVTMRNGSEQGGNVTAVRQIAYILYGNVDGRVTKTAKILENEVPSFLFEPPIFGTSLVENTGNVYTRATYKLQVFPLFSDEEVFTNEETPDDNVVFPETRRYNRIQWDGAPQLGIFKVRQTVEIFDEKSVTEKLVFLCPIWFLFLVLLIFFVAVFWIVSRIIKRKKEA